MTCTLQSYHQEMFSGENLKNLIGPFQLQSLSFLPRVINAPVALMPAPQNPQGSIILGWHHRMICFLTGPCTFLLAPTKHWGRSLVNLSGACLGLPRPLLVWVLFPSSPHCDPFWRFQSLSFVLFLFFFVLFVTELQMMASFL